MTHTRTHTNAKPAARPRTQRDSAQDYLSLAVLPWPLGAFASRKGSRVLLTSACNHCLHRRCSWCHRFLTLEHVGLQAGDKDIHSSHAGPRVLGWRRRRRRRRRRGGGGKGTSYLGVATLGFVATPALGTRLASGTLGRLGWRGQYLDLDSGHGGRTRAHTHGNTHAHDNTHDNTTCGWRCVGERTGWGWRGRQSSLVLRLDWRWEGL